MKWKSGFFFILIAFVVLNCSKTKELTVDRSRALMSSKIFAFHDELTVNVGWIPYADQRLIQTGKNEWKIVEHTNDDKIGAIPVIVITYPGSNDTLLLDMDIENELLGKLIKHSVMVQEKISRPFTTFFEEAKCQRCHPEHIEVDFSK